MAVKAKFYVQQITRNASGGCVATLAPVIRGEENREWSKYTPSGKVELNLNPDAGAAGEWFESRLGQDVSITFDDIE